MRKDSSDVTRELKLALIVGFALVLTVAILVSDHLSKARNATLATVTGNARVAAKAPEQPIRSPEDILPPSMPAAVEVATTGGTPTTPAGTDVDIKPVNTETTALPPVVIGQAAAGPHKETKFGPGKTELSSNPTRTVAYVPPQQVAPGATPQDIVKNEVQKKADAAKPTAPSANEKTYKVVEGDSFFAIAKKFYNDGSLSKQLASANAGRLGSGGTLRAGATIVIPSKESLTGKPEASKPDAKLAAKAPAKSETKPESKPVSKVEESKVKSYQVKPGDTLSNIARHQLGSPARSNEIASLNRMDPEDDLLAGAILKIPAR